MSDKYKLDGHKPILCENLMEWAEWFETADNHVAKTILQGPDNIDIEVSTVFLGIDHCFSGKGEPILFETMVFGGPMDEEMIRYQTWEQAEQGHIRMVKKVESLL